MATTIISKYGSGAPSASDVVRGELAVDTENGRLYTETSGGSVIEIGLKPSSSVGINTTSPQALIHVQRNGAAVSGVDAQTVAAFQSTGSSGSSSYIGILGGSTGSTGQAGIHFGDADDPDVGQIIYRNNDNSMAFVTNTAEAMRVDSSGKLLVGTTTDTGDGLSIRPRISGSGTTTQLLFNRADTTNTGYPLLFENNGTQVGSISHTNTATAFNTSSDYRLKENIVTLSGATERLKQLKPSRFNFIANPNTTVDGFLAHEVQDIVPEAITGAKDAVDEEGNPVYQGIDQSKLVPLLVATIQELEARIAALEGAN